MSIVVLLLAATVSAVLVPTGIAPLVLVIATVACLLAALALVVTTPPSDV